MSHIRETSHGQSQFSWPEFLVIDVVAEQYYGLIEPNEIGRIARLHAQMLRYVFENDLRMADAARKRLVADCRSLGVGETDIAAVDRCAFWEIAGLIHRHLRPTARASAPIAAVLHAAVCRLGSIGAVAA